MVCSTSLIRLHYAAIAGQAESAALLLRFGANPDAESALGETALQVAEQNPAAYLGVDTGAVQACLCTPAVLDEA